MTESLKTNASLLAIVAMALAPLLGASAGLAFFIAT
jgi:hypothetical protein